MNPLKEFARYGIAMLIAIIMTAANTMPPIKIGDKAPDFILPAVTNSEVALSNYKGKIVVIHIWSHTCSHCRVNNKTLPGIVGPYKKSNLAYIMINIDTDTSGWRSIIKEDKLNFAIHATDVKAKTMSDYNAAGTPCINIADEKGKLIAIKITDIQLKKILKKRFPGIVSES